MPVNRSRSNFTSTIAASFRRLMGKRNDSKTRRQRARRRLLEQLESRQLMALNIVSLSPADGAINWALNTDLTITFDAPVQKGQGTINVVQDGTNVLGVAVDVNSPNVTIAGAVVTVDLPTDLLANTSYHILIDDGAFLDTTAVQTTGATLLTQNFDVQPLQPFGNNSAGNAIGGGDGTDFSLTPPIGFSTDNTAMPTGGLAPFRGWSLLDKNSWIRQAGDQFRSSFTRGSGTVALGDPDQFDDDTNGGAFNSKFISRPIRLGGVAANSVVLEFDSSFRPEDSQVGTLDVRFDGGAWTNILTLDPSNTSNDDPGEVGNAPLPPIPAAPVNLNERLVSGVNTGVSTGGNDRGKGNAPFRAVQNPAGASTMEFRWGVTGRNDWWWALDNLKVSATVTGTPFTGIANATTWNLDIPRLTVGIDKESMSENGGTAVGTVTRNGAPSNWTTPLTVTLASNDTTEATVPATITIPANQASTTFPVTAVDDLISDRTQTVLISASAATFAEGSRSIAVLDDEGPKVVSLSPADNATGVDYKSNLVINFDVDVRKGSGLINIVRTSGNVLVASIDVNSPTVTVAGRVVTIDPPINLNGLTDYYVLVDDGALVDTTTTPSVGSILLKQDFDLLPLGSNQLPTGFAATGWNIISKETFIGLGGSSNFTSGTGTVAVTTGQDQYLRTSPINLTGIGAGSVVIEFDASYAGGLPKLGSIQVSYDGGGSWLEIAQFEGSVANSHVVITRTGVTGATLLNPLNNPTSGSMIFRFGQQFNSGGYFAIDNLKITGDIQGLPFQGFNSATDWNFTTALAPILTVTIDKSSMSENGGTAIGTVTSNFALAQALTVQLTSSDITEATVPATAIIPAGAAGTSVTFPITAVDDLLGDGNQSVMISASAIDFFSVSASISVLDDDFPKIVSLSPVDNATAVPVGANLVVTFDQNVKKGNGFVHVVRVSDGKAAQSIDIQSAAVTIAGAAVTINPPADLAGLTNYYIAFEEGAILSTTASVKTGAPLLSQDFELMTLGPAIVETVGLNPNGRDWTNTPPSGYAVDNTLMPPGGVPEWKGWTFADKSFWATQGGQNRVNFTRGQGTMAIGETDEWEDLPQLSNRFNSLLTTAPINLANVVAGSAVLEFDSSFRPEGSNPASAPNNQTGILDVSYDGGTTWSNLFQYDVTNTNGSATAPNVNERKVVPLPSHPNSGNMVFRFGLTGTNDWWWAIDNIKVIGDTNGLPFPGISNTDATTWNFATAEAQTLTVSVDPVSIAENGGTVTGTVTRNLGNDAVTVSLTSADTTLATVPATVTIPAGQASATFTITIVDDAFADGLKRVAINATATGFVAGAATVSITDNETPNVIISEIMYNSGATKTEWLELYNRGTIAADLSDWRIDNPLTLNWGGIPKGTMLPPGKTAVIYNSFFADSATPAPAASITDAEFRADWNLPPDSIVVGTFWSDLRANETLRLLDAGAAAQNVVVYTNTSPAWPVAGAGASIYLTSVSADNTVGTNWASSVVGNDRAVNPVAASTNYSVANIGSPGAIPPLTLISSNFTADASGIAVRFGRVLDVTKLNLVDSNGVNGASDVTLVGNSVGAVSGSVVLDADGRGFRFLKSGGPLAADTYTLTLRSAANGFTDLAGNLLDGDDNGTPGDNFVRTFTVAAIPDTTVLISVGDFIRGAGQTVNLPTTTTNGIPVTISTGVNVAGASFELRYNPALLTITGGTTPIAGATVTVNTTTAGVAIVSVTSSAQFSATAGALTLVNLAATVPTTAPIGPKSVLRLANPSVTAVGGAALTNATDDGLQISAYKGDVNNSNSITTGDVTGLLRTISGGLSTTGFPSFKLADPTIVGDMNDSSSLTTGDATGLLRFISGVGGGFPAIPALPTGLTPVLGADPQIFVPQNLTVTPGNSIQVPINIRVTEPAGVSVAGVDVSFTYDSTRFTIGAITTGAALNGFTFSSSNNTAVAGVARLVYASDIGPAFPNGFVGTLLNVTLTARADAAPGASAINLTRAGASDNDTNDLTIAPAITNGVDSSDGIITIPGAANQAPTGLALAPTTIAENAGANATVGTLTTTDPDTGDTFVYTLVTGTGSTDNAAFNISGSTLRANASFDFETKSSYSVRVRTTDQGGLFFEREFVITVTNVNETPVFNPTSYTFGIAENSATGTAVGTVSATDVDAGTSLVYSLTGVGAANFAINASTGAITVAAGAVLNFEGTNLFSLTASVTDGTLSTTAPVTINVTNVNESPVFAPPTYTFALAENSATGAAVGTVTATDVEGTALTYSLSGTGAANFVINTATGAITVAAGAVLDFEGTQTFNLTATASDGTLSATAPVTINLTNVNEAPAFNPATYTFSLAENSATGAAVGTVVATDVDAGTTLTYSLSGTGSANFVINTATGAITVAAGAVLDFEGTRTFNLTATASDGTLSATAPVTINLTNVNEAPAFNPATYTFSLAENSATGAAVGTVVATDVDAGTTLTYSLSGTGSANFVINTATGAITVAAGAVLDFEGTRTFNLTATASDGTLSATAPVTINLTNVNEAPVFNPATYTFSLSDNAATGAAVGTVVATDVDAGTTLTYSLSGTGSANFVINTATGAITVAAGASLNAGTTPVYNLTATVSDGTLSATAPVTINVSSAPVAPRLVSVAVNGGDTFKTPAQRSEVTSLVVTFSAPVTIAAGAFSIVDVGLLSAQNPVLLPQPQLLITPNAANTQFTIRFGAGPGVITRGSDIGQGRGNSLADGNYVLSLDATKISDGVSNLSATNSLGDGDNEFGDLATDAFFRMFGDSNGDGLISTSDTAAFRASLTAYDAAFDWDGDGTISGTGIDRTNFLGNFGKRRRV